MDELVVKAYRKLCREGFVHTGEIKNPSIFLDTVGEKIRVCAHITHAYIHIYIKVKKDTIENIKYLCTCDPTANVVLEILCTLLRGKTIKEAEAITEKEFVQALGSSEEEFLKKVRGVIELLHRGITRYTASKN